MTSVIRPVTKLSDEQQALLDQAIAAAKRADAAEDVAWQKIKAARDVGVPDTVLCERTGRSRATLNRRFGRRNAT